MENSVLEREINTIFHQLSLSAPTFFRLMPRRSAVRPDSNSTFLMCDAAIRLANAALNSHILSIEIWPDNRLVVPSLNAGHTFRQLPNIDEPG
jgi:hypothetical protein